MARSDNRTGTCGVVRVRLAPTQRSVPPSGIIAPRGQAVPFLAPEDFWSQRPVLTLGADYHSMLTIAGHLIVARAERDDYVAGCRPVVEAARLTPG
jgi:hypothetical protein